MRFPVSFFVWIFLIQLKAKACPRRRGGAEKVTGKFFTVIRNDQIIT
jgi:hypothetical protein